MSALSPGDAASDAGDSEDIERSLVQMVRPFTSTEIAEPRRADGLCEHCGQRPATVIWIGEGDMLTYAHGGGSNWCERCCVEEQLEYARKRAAEIPALEQRLRELTGT